MRDYPSGSNTHTEGTGNARTLRPQNPLQADSNDKESSQCHSFEDAQNHAIRQFKHDISYYKSGSYYAHIYGGIHMDLTFGTAGCVVEFDCDNHEFGGLNRKQIKDEYYCIKDHSK